MAKPEPEIDNTVRYTKFSGLKFLAFAIVFFVTGVMAIIKFDSYFTDFWKIRNCDPSGYARGEFMYSCGGIKVDRYHFGALYLGVQKDAAKSARTADVLIFGNSRTFRSFSTTEIDQYFKDKGLTYMVMAVEGASFRSAIKTIESLNLKPKIIMVNNEIFYTDKISPAFSDLVEFPDKYKTRYQFFHTAQTMQKEICSSKFTTLKSHYCNGTNLTRWRSADTGRINWDLEAEPEKQILVTYKPDSRLSLNFKFSNNAKQLLNHPNILKNSCPVLYLVNSPVSSPQLMKAMADDIGVQSAFSHVDGIYTYDKSHLDRPNSEKWAKEFVKSLDPAIDYCLAGNKREERKELTLSEQITDGKSDFETWRAVAGTVVLNNAAKAPNKDKNADRIKIKKPGSKIQLIMSKQAISSGDKVKFGIWLWATEMTTARIQIGRSCSAKTPIETASLHVTLSEKPRRFEIEHTFEHDHKCAMVQIVGLNPESEIIAWQSLIDYVPVISIETDNTQP